MKKYIIKYAVMACLSLGLTAMTTSCTDYLDKAPESDVTLEDAFKDFHNFQGFVEELYACIPDMAKQYWTSSWNWGEDEVIGIDCNYHMGYKVDQGDFWGWQAEHDGWGAGFMDSRSLNLDYTTPNNGFRWNRDLWPASWYGIRKCNMGLANLELLTDATQEQRNAIAGQLYFFRGWFHFMLMQYFGGLPYIDRVLPPNETFGEPRLSYHECADKAAEDFRQAVSLLPIDWDKTSISPSTKGNNQLRINKIMALGYLGKNLLWAGSPLMNKESTGSTSYNQEYCRQAAEAFGELLTLVESGQTQYSLVDFEHYSDLFYTYGKNGMLPGSTEALFRGLVADGWQNTRYGVSLQFVPVDYKGENNPQLSPTANYVHYYGMANGLPLDDPESDWDKTHPWKGRDPRFYHDIRFDGSPMVSKAKVSEAGALATASLYTGGSARDDQYGSRTGFLLGKFIPVEANKFDDGWGWSPQMHIYCSYMRLADIYLMYAEAAANANGVASGKSSNCSLTAIDAINRIRTRAGVDGVNTKYTGSIEAFNGEIRRERAVELAYESHRFNDLRRWLLLDKDPYTKKTAVDFDRVGDLADNPQETAVSNYRYRVIVTRNFTEKHYWLPLKLSDVTLYPEFYQNPGW